MEITQTKVVRTFGVQDLYVDTGHPTNQQHIEDLLSKLECQAAGIIAKARKSFEKGEDQVLLTRPDRHIVQKFIFMTYRLPLVRERCAWHDSLRIRRR